MRSRSPSVDQPSCPPGRVPPGTRYTVPPDVLAALGRLFGRPEVDRIAVVYRPWYVHAHLMLIGARVGSVTRPERIYTNLAEDVFFALDRHVLHEYYHVVQQWGRERMTRIGYLLGSARREREAWDFVEANLDLYRLSKRLLPERLRGREPQ